MDLPLYLPATTIYTGVPYVLADTGLAVIMRGRHIGRGILSAQFHEPAPGTLRATMTLSAGGADLWLDTVLPPSVMDGARLVCAERMIDHLNPVDVPRKNPRKKPRIEYPEVELRLYRAGRIDPAA